MFYDKIEESKLSLGKAQEFNKEEDKFLIPIFYNGVELNFALKNKYVVISGIETNIYDKKFVVIKSKEYAEIVDMIANKFECSSPILPDGSFRANLNNKTKFVDEIPKGGFEACISLNFPTIFKDKKTTLQINIREVVVTKTYDEYLKVDLDKLEKAM